MINRDAIKLLLILWMTLIVIVSQAQNIGINATGSTPNTSAGLDVDFTNKGMLVPRVALTGTGDVATIATPATSLLVYNSATAGVSPNNVVPSFYYWNGTQWMRLETSTTSSTSDWSVNGNSGTNNSNFIGTTDNIPLNFRVNNLRAGILAMGTTFFGYQSGNSGYGSSNTAFGYRTLFSLGSGSDNVAVGSFSLYSNLDGIRNSALGYGTLNANTSGNNNTAVGHNALTQNTNGSNNSSIGYGSLFSNTNGWYNTAIGLASLRGNVGGDANTASGFYSLFSNISGNGSTAVGNYALYNTNASKNSALGDSTGVSNINGTLNTYIGYFANSSNGLTNATAIGANSLVTASNSLVLGNNANVGIGISAPTEKLEVVGKTKTNQLQVVTGATNGFILTSDATGNATWQNPSSLAGWGLTGNAGTNAATNFIGTTDNIAFVARTNNTERMRISATGNVGIGQNNPTELLHLKSTAYAPDPSFGNRSLTIEGANTNGNSSSIVFRYTGSTSAQISSYIYGSLSNNTNYAGGLTLGVNNGSGPTDVMYFYSSRNAYFTGTDFTSRSRVQSGDLFNDGQLAIYSDQGATDFTLSFNANTAMTQNVNYYFPSDDGSSNQVLTTDGSGNLSWASMAVVSPSWELTGNSGTSAATNFIGTADAIDFVTRTNNIERIRITSAGNVGIGNAVPTQKLDVVGNIYAETGQYKIFNATNDLYRGNLGKYGGAAGFDFNGTGAISGIALENGENESGGFYADGDMAGIWSPGDNDILKLWDEDGMVLRARLDGLGNWFAVSNNATSDERLKKNIRPLPIGSLDKIMSLQGKIYDWREEIMFKGEIEAGKEIPLDELKNKIGFIAQELELVLPEVVVTNKLTGYKAVNYDGVIPVMVEAMKEQQTQIEDLKSQNENLTKEVLEMKKMMQEIIESNKK